MAIILESYPLPNTGHLHLSVIIDADIKVSAAEAQKVVSRRLFKEVSYLLWAESPALVVNARTVWRVPIFIGLVNIGRIGPLATIDVDVETGELQDITSVLIEEMKQRVQQHVASQTPATAAPS